MSFIICNFVNKNKISMDKKSNRMQNANNSRRLLKPETKETIKDAAFLAVFLIIVYIILILTSTF